MLRRKRLPDGSLGPLENVFNDKEDVSLEQKVTILETENQDLKQQLLEVQNYIVEQQYNDLLDQGGM